MSHPPFKRLLPLWHEREQKIQMIYGVYLKSERLLLGKKMIQLNVSLDHIFQRTGISFSQTDLMYFQSPDSQIISSSLLSDEKMHERQHEDELYGSMWRSWFDKTK